VTPPTSPILEATGISRTFQALDGPLSILREAGLALHAGRMTGIIGPSGSGKTTMLMIAGLLDAPTSGEVRLWGERVSYPHVRLDALREARRRHLGFVFQHANLIPYLTAVENVAIALEIAGHNTAVAMQRAAAALSELGLGARLHNLPARLSGGEQQRVSIARAIANRPAVIFADEPTAALDAARAHQVMELFRNLATEHQLAICVVSHDSRWEGYVDQLLEVADGRLNEVPRRVLLRSDTRV
jgi:putative ABC transport system ATP-binding protein